MSLFETLDWQNHPLGLPFQIAKTNGCSVIPDGGFSKSYYEVMTPDGEVHRNLTSGEVDDILNEYG